MSTALPPIISRSGSNANRQRRMVAAKSTVPSSASPAALIKAEKQPMRKPELAVQPATTLEPQRVTTDRRKELCVQLLRGVHVESFAEFFQLTSADLDGQGLATNDSVMELLQHNLSKWEDAIQARDYDTAVGARQRLAEIFSQRNSPRNAVHHSRQALATAKLSRRPPLLAEAYAELGSQLRDMGEGQEARELLTSMLRLAEQHSLGGDHGVAAACNHLAQTYVQLAAQMNSVDGLNQLREAETLAKRSANPQCLRLVILNLAQALENSGDLAAATDYYHKYVAIEGGEADARGRSHACLGLARCCEKQGDPQAAKSYLAELVDLSVQLSELRVAAESCSRLGKIVTVEGQHEQAKTWFEKAQKFARDLGDTQLLNLMRARAGVAQAETLMPSLMSHLVSNTPGDLAVLLDWCSNRQGLAVQQSQGSS